MITTTTCPICAKRRKLRKELDHIEEPFERERLRTAQLNKNDEVSDFKRDNEKEAHKAFLNRNRSPKPEWTPGKTDQLKECCDTVMGSVSHKFSNCHYHKCNTCGKRLPVKEDTFYKGDFENDDLTGE